MTLKVECPYCHEVREVEPNPADRGLAITVMDHRTKFIATTQTVMWAQRYGDNRPEDVFPDLVGYDVDAHYARLRDQRREVHGERVP